jgi:hypothetical protein
VDVASVRAEPVAGLDLFDAAVTANLATVIATPLDTGLLAEQVKDPTVRLPPMFADLVAAPAAATAAEL